MRRGSAGGAARTIPSDGPAGRSMPTSPQTSILAAVTQVLPGPTMRSTGSRPASGSPYARAPIACAPPATMKASTSSRPAAPRRTGFGDAVPVGGRRDDDLGDARDLRRDDGHHQRSTGRAPSHPGRRRRRARAGSSAARSRCRGRWGCDSRRAAGSRRSGGRGRSPGRARDGRAARGGRARRARSAASRTRRPSRAATTHGDVGVADGGVATRANVGEGRAGGRRGRAGRGPPRAGSGLDGRDGQRDRPPRPRRDRGAQAERGCDVGRRPPDGRCRASRPRPPGARLTGRSSRSAGRGSRTRRRP